MVCAIFPTDPLSGEDKYYIFSKGIYRVGRKGCDIIINKDKGVSRIHAEITCDAMPSLSTPRNKCFNTSFSIRIKDSSKYGTFIRTSLGKKNKVHDFPNKEAALNDGDIITFGTGTATYRFCFIQLVFYICCSETFQGSRRVEDKVSSIGAYVAPTLSQECTHVLVEKNMPVNEDLINAIVAKKPVALISWVELVAEKSIRTEMPSYSQHIPSVTVEELSVEIVDSKAREKCLEGYTFVLEPQHKYKFGDSFQSLLEAGGAKTLSIEEIFSSSQDSEYGEINRMICVIPKSSGDKFDRFKKLSSLSRVNEMDLVCAILSGNLAPSILISPAVVVSSSCSTDETVVADSDAEEETSSVRAIDSAETPKLVNKLEIKDESGDAKLEGSPVPTFKDKTDTMGASGDRVDESKSVTSGYPEHTHNISGMTAEIDRVVNPKCGKLGDDVGSGLTPRRDKIDEPECGNPDIIYSQDLIVRDPKFTRTVRSEANSGVVNFKRFRKMNTPSGNSFSSLIPFSEYPYKEYENGEMTDYMKEEKKRKQMEAIAEDLFNNEKGRKHGKAGSSHGFFSHG